MKISQNKEKAGGMIINWIAVFAQIVISLFFIPFFLVTVGDKQYGLYSFSTSIVAWIDTLMVAVASAYYKFLTREKKRYGEYGEARACGVFWKLFLIIAVLILFVGISFDALLYSGVIPLNEYSITEKNQICLIILMSVISTSLSCYLTTRKSYHYYKQKYILLYSFSLGQVVVQSLLSFVFLKLGFGVISVAAAHFGVALICTVLLSILSKFLLKEKISIRKISEEDKEHRRKLFFEILVFSSFVIINTVVDTMNKTLDKTILGFYNANSVATYQLAYTIPSYLISFTSIISIVFVQHINEVYYSGGGTAGMNSVFLKVSKIQTVFTFLIVGGFIACGKEFIFLWIDDTRIQVYFITCILMATYSITCCNRLAIMIRRVQNFHIKASLIYLGIAIFNILLSLLLVNLVDKEDAIWACVIGTSFTYLIGHWVIMQIYDAKVCKIAVGGFFKNFLKYIILALTLDLIIIRSFVLLPISNLIICFVLKGTIYLLFYFCFVLITDKYFLGLFLRVFKRLKKR